MRLLPHVGRHRKKLVCRHELSIVLPERPRTAFRYLFTERVWVWTLCHLAAFEARSLGYYTVAAHMSPIRKLVQSLYLSAPG